MTLRPLAVALTLFAAPAFAQHVHPAPPAPRAESAATAALRAANMKMHKDMDITFSGDADVDFVRAMIPHHQGAVEMARVQLAHGKDAEIRKLAEEIVAAQEKEIAVMKAFLKRKGAAQ